MKKPVLLALLLFVLDLGVKSQLIVWDDTLSIHRNYRYEDYGDPESMPNFIINKMAVITAPTRAYFFGFTLYLHRRIIKLNKSDYLIKIYSDSISYYNKMNYLGYQLNALVFPDTVSMQVLLHDRNSGKPIRYVTKGDFSPLGSLHYSFHQHDSTGMAFYAFQKTECTFVFGSSKKKKLLAALSFIQETQRLSPELDSINGQLQKLEQVKPGMVRLYFSDLKRMEERLEAIDPALTKPGIESEGLADEGVVSKYRRVKDYAHRIHKQFDRMNRVPEYEYFNEGYQALRRGDETRAKAYFKKSIAIKEHYAPPWYYLALLHYRHGSYDSCATIIVRIIQAMEPDMSTRSQTLSLAKEEYDELCHQASLLIMDSRLTEAIQKLKTALVLCERLNEMACSGEAERLMGRAKSDLLDSWLSISNKALDNNKLPLALDYMRWTRDYYQKNKAYLPETTAFDSLNVKLIHLMLLRARATAEEGDYSGAMVYVLLIDSVCRQSSAAECQQPFEELKTMSYSGRYRQMVREVQATDERQEQEQALERARLFRAEHHFYIRSLPDSLVYGQMDERYHADIDQGLSKLRQGDYGEAIQYFEDARDLELRYPVEADDSLADYLRQAWHPLLLSELDDSKLKAWGGYYELAEGMLRSVKETMIKNKLETDSLLNARVREVEQTIRRKVCDTVAKAFLRHLQNGNRNAALGDYLSAELSWTGAATIARQHADCHLDRSMALRKLDKYHAAMVYQKQLKLIDSLMRHNQDSLAVLQWKQSQRWYKQRGLAVRGLQAYGELGFRCDYGRRPEVLYFLLKDSLGSGGGEELLPLVVELIKAEPRSSKYEALVYRTLDSLAATYRDQGLGPVEVYRRLKELPSFKYRRYVLLRMSGKD